MPDLVNGLLYLLALFGLYGLFVALTRALRGTRGAVPRRRSFRPFLSLLVIVREGESVVEGLVRNLAGLPYFNRAGLTNYDVVVVDHHSLDQTPQIMERLTKRYGNVRFTRVNRGEERGEAIEAGLRLCRGRTVIVLDATQGADTKDLLRTVYYLVGPKDEPMEGARPKALQLPEGQRRRNARTPSPL